MNTPGKVLTPFLVCIGLAAGAGRLAPTAQTAQPQRPAQAPVFKSRIDLVRLDLAVLDNGTGKPVTGLTEHDFTVSEDRVRQTIGTFQAESEAPRPAQVSSAAAPTSQARRVFLILLGAYRLEGPVHPFEGVMRFLRERLRPDDLVSVMAFNRATAFTTDHEHLAQVVERVKLRRDGIALEMMKEAVKTRFRNEDISPTIQALIDELFHMPGSGDATRNLTSMLLGSPELRRNERTWRPWNREVVFRDLLKVFAGIDYLRPLEGEKHLICITRSGLSPPPIRFVNGPVGLRLDSAEDDKRLAARANDAQVALDIIHTTGTSAGIDFSLMSSKNVSDHSGGQFTSLRTADDALARIDGATRTGYVLGYMPTNPSLDGKYRNVHVAVNRKNVTVLVRRGYTARAELPPVDIREIVTRRRLRDAATTDVAQNDIALQAKASLVSGPGAARQVRVELNIDASRLTLTEAGATWEGSIDLMILCGDAKQNIVGKLDQQMTLGLDEQRYNQAMSSGIPYVATVPLTGAATHVKVLVYDFASDRMGVKNVTFK